MNRHRWTTIVLGGVLLTAISPASASAQGARTGLIPEVTVAQPTRLDWQGVVLGFGAEKLPDAYDSRKQKYLLYVPKTYNAAKAWPLVVFISPGAAPGGDAWQKACAEHGVLFCAAYQAGNNVPVTQRVRIVLDMFDDVRRQYRIDPEQTYITGFSGGGRMACSIGFALPEYFGGVAPLCGTNPLADLTYLRHRVRERQSVAFVTGETDFNRKENEVYLHPQFEELGIRTKLWVVPKLGHGVPSPAVLGEVYQWLAADLKRRQADVAAHPKLRVTPDESPTAAQQAERLVEAAQGDLKTAERAWQGVALLQGVMSRWPGTAGAAKARQALNGLLKDEQLLKRIEEQGGADERRYLAAQAKSLQRFGKADQALQAWELLQRLHPDSAEGRMAATEIKKLQGKR
jgi:dienelactone hydrolase